MSTQREDFIKKYGSGAVVGALTLNLFPSVMMAQAIIEKGDNAAPGNNVFGIKADSGWKGKVISTTTHEGSAGQILETGSGKIYLSRDAAIAAGENPVSLFRAYNSIADSFFDRNKFLLQNPRYANVFAAKTPEEQAQLLEDDGYAEAKNYNETINSVIAGSNLKQLDKKKTLCEQVLSF